LIILTFLYSRYTYYADAYPKLEMMPSETVVHKIVTYLQQSADFLKAFSQGKVQIPPEKTTMQKLEDYITNIPAIKAVIDEARTIHKENFQSQFLTEVYTRIFGKQNLININQHISMRGLVYDTIILSVLCYFLYQDSTYANMILIGDSMYKMFLLLIWHFKQSPFERLSNYFLSFFTNLRTFDIISMFKSNWEILYDHRSVIANFTYLGLLCGFMAIFGDLKFNFGFNFPLFQQPIAQQQPTQQQTTKQQQAPQQSTQQQPTNQQQWAAQAEKRQNFENVTNTRIGSNIAGNRAEATRH